MESANELMKVLSEKPIADSTGGAAKGKDLK